MGKRKRKATKQASRKLVADNAHVGNGYNPRVGLDVPMGKGHLHGRMSEQEADEQYLTNSIAKNIVDMPAEDITRNGWVLSMDNDELADDLMERMRELNVKGALTQMFKYQRLYGAGAVFIGVDTKSQSAPQDELDVTSLRKITYLTPFSTKKIDGVVLNDDVTSPNYGKMMELKLSNDRANHTRLLFANGLALEEDDIGRSIFEGMLDELRVAHVAINSIRKMLDDYVFKVYKSADAGDMSAEDKLLIASLAQHQFETDALAIIADNEELSHETKSVAGIQDLLNYSWERIASAARMPKSIIMGQESGTLTGAQYDLMNYYARIKTIQENDVRPSLEKIVRMLLQASDEPGGAIDPDSVHWSIDFNSLFQLDESTASDIQKKVAETDNIYIKAGVLTPEEVKESRFSSTGVTNGGNLHQDSADELSNTDDDQESEKWFKSIWGKLRGE